MEKQCEFLLYENYTNGRKQKNIKDIKKFMEVKQKGRKTNI